jgi:glycosyltransferase involved in cell wall biosynthesis
MDAFTSSVKSALANLIKSYHEPDFYILIDDYALSLSSVDRKAPLGFWCQGLPQTFSLSEVSPFLKSKPKTLRFILKSLLTPFFLKTIRRVNSFDFVLSNSHYTADWLYFFTGIRSKVIYPPVDCEFFKPEPEGVRGRYMLTFGSAVDTKVIERLGGKYHIVNLGDMKIKNCENLGYVSDEQLVKLYSGALLTLFPQFHEPFGYIPVESMACGTPVLAYNAEGPRETIIDGVTGWLADTPVDFIETVEKVWKERYNDDVRKACRTHVLENFSIEVCVDKLINYLDKIPY